MANLDPVYIRLILHIIFLAGGAICWWYAYKYEKNGILPSASNFYWYSFGLFIIDVLAGDLLIAIWPAIFTAYKGYSIGKQIKKGNPEGR